MKSQAATAGAAMGRGMAAIITTTFGFIWLGWGFGSNRSLTHEGPHGTNPLGSMTGFETTIDV